ncbi:acid protease [Coniochaeta ligniaria NRRL 30616]|uniref:Acid protease n=1 Tax=Coniochaeta ligniaria NRRL 30616 TaxID=1408157 RepID=A0A1J7JF05_9PEZI|nr:acid protease [Coniochaeta ligniaria NRRL 30616]
MCTSTLRQLLYSVALLGVLAATVHGVQLSHSVASSSAADIYHSTKARYNKGSESPEPYTWDSQFLVQLEIGTPPQLLDLVLDTGSSDLWVFSPQVPDWQKPGHNEYDPSLSSTSKPMPNATWAVRYGDGSTSQGNVVTDVVSVAGIPSLSQAVETATNVSIDFYGSPRADGIIGFGFSQRNKVKPQPQKTWFDNIKGTLKHGLFTLDLRHNDSSTLDIGFVDHSKHTGKVEYLPTSVTHQGAWGFNGTGFTVAGRQVDPPANSSVLCIADSGSSLMIIDDILLSTFYALVPAASYNATEQLWVFPCGAELPDFGVRLGDRFVATVPPSYLEFGQTGYDPDLCYGSLQSNAGLNLSIYGITFLKSLFVVFDDENSRLGFARKPLIA